MSTIAVDMTESSHLASMADVSQMPGARALATVRESVANRQKPRQQRTQQLPAVTRNCIESRQKLCAKHAAHTKRRASITRPFAQGIDHVSPVIAWHPSRSAAAARVAAEEPGEASC